MLLVAEETITTYLQRIMDKADLKPGQLVFLLAQRGIRRTASGLTENISGKKNPNPATIRALADLPQLQAAGFDYDTAMRLAGHLRPDAPPRVVLPPHRAGEETGEYVTLSEAQAEVLELSEGMSQQAFDAWLEVGRMLSRPSERPPAPPPDA